MAGLLFNSFKRDLMNGSIDLDTDTIKVMLVTSSYTPADTHDKRDDVTNEVSGRGYTAGGATQANKCVTQDSTDKVGALDALLRRPVSDRDP